MSSFLKNCGCKKNTYCDCDKEIYKEKHKKKESRKERQITLTCGIGNGFAFDAAGTLDQIVIPDPSSAIVAQVSIEASTRGISTVEIDFSSIITLDASDEDARGAIIFRLFRACGNEEAEIVNTWTYEVLEIEDFNEITLSNSFSFTFCECLKDAGCCSYYVEASVGGLINIDTLSVSNVHISAITQ